MTSSLNIRRLHWNECVVGNTNRSDRQMQQQVYEWFFPEAFSVLEETNL